METDAAPAPAITPATTVVGEGPVGTVFAVDAAAVKVFRDAREPGPPPPRHPSIVAETGRGTLDAPNADGAAYVSTPLARRSLAVLVRETSKRSWHEATALGVRLAGALAAAHAAGSVHGGVKPENVLVMDTGDDATGSAGLADFAHGSWRAAMEGSVGARARAGLGYMAPEVLEGAEPDAASDVYSLGATLSFALSGEVPFAGDGDETLMRTLHRILSDPVPDLRPLRVPDDLAAVLEKAMAKQASLRYTSAVELGEALRSVQRSHSHTVTPLDPDEEPAEGSGVDVTSPALSSTPPATSPSRARAWAIGALAAVAVLVVAAGVMLLLMSRRPQPGDSVAATQAPPTAASTPPSSAALTATGAETGDAASAKGRDDSVFVDVPGFHLGDQAEDSVVSDPSLAGSIFQKANVALVRTDDGRDVGVFVVLVLQEQIADDPETLAKIVDAVAPDPPVPPEATEIGGQPMIVTTTSDGLTAIAAQDPSGLIVGLLRGRDRPLMEQFLTALGQAAQ